MTYDEAIKHFGTQLGDNFKDIVDLLRLTAMLGPVWPKRDDDAKQQHF